jgi:hypothetical protein
MAEHALKLRSAYAGSCFILTTKHAKSIAIAPPFWEKLEASVLEYVVDTDALGTFSGEVEREGNALQCARRKCEWSLERLGHTRSFLSCRAIMRFSISSTADMASTYTCRI